MAKSDEEIDKISSGNIDDIFSSLGSSDDETEESDTINNSENITDDMRSKYMIDDSEDQSYNDTEEEENIEEDDPKEEDTEEEDPIVKEFDEEIVNVDVDKEESTEENESSKIDFDEDPFESLIVDNNNDNKSSENTEESVKDETDDEFDPLVSDFNDDIETEESIDEENIDEEPIKDNIESSDVDESAIQQTKETVEEPKPEEPKPEEPVVVIEDEEKASIEDIATIKAGDNVDANYNLKDYMIESFNKRIDETLTKYTRNEVLTYIEKFKNDNANKDMISQMYSEELLHYSEYIDFSSEEAKMSLWVIVGGKFADFIESQKAIGNIESSADSINLGKSNNEIEDPNIAEINKHKLDAENKYNEYKLDRTVFAIADEEEDDEASIFDDKRTLEKDFFNSPFYSILKEVMESDRMYDMSKIQMKVVINADTAYIPIVDFSTGIRVVCIDVNDVDQYHIHPMLLSRKTKFSYPVNNRTGVRVRMLYSDACVEKPEATLFALRKIIAFNYIKPKRKISLANNYVIAYTTEPKYIEMFEKGDSDSRMPENSTYYTPKPHNKSIGIIALNKKSERDRQAMRRNQAKQDTNRYSESDVRDYNINFVLSAEYICNDRLLVDPTISQENRHVEYLITQYNECNPVIIMDGLQTICACIIKEHYAKYGRSTRYSIEYECDRAGLVSPSVIALIDEHAGLELSTFRNGNNGPLNIDRNFILPPSRLKLDGVFDFERGRVDRRFMCGATISRHYPRELVSNYDLSTMDGVAEFLNSRGFKEFWEPSTVVYDVMPYVLNIIETSNLISDIHKVSLASLSDRNSADKDALLFAQEKLEYFKKLDKEHVGGLQRLLFGVIDMFISGEFNN